jgi:flagellar biosynthesis protein FlhB
MAEELGGDRTERATPKRREEARKRGQVVLSPEVSPVAVLLGALGLAWLGAPRALATLREVLASWLAGAGPAAVHDDAVFPALGGTLVRVAAALGPFFVTTALVGTAAVVAQVGFAVHPELVLPKAERVSPAAGAKRLFSSHGAMSLLKALVKIALVLGVAYSVVGRIAREGVATPAMAVDDILAFTGRGLAQLFATMAMVLAALGLADFLWQRRRHEQQLRMTRQEVKQETKESEGDPQVRQRFRKAHREYAKRRMLADVKGADVVLTNPIHYAVALRYRPHDMAAPRVVAKGAGELAQRIKETARAAGVPIVERRALARALYRTVAVGAEIPPALYRAVAEILAYIYGLRGRPAAAARP